MAYLLNLEPTYKDTTKAKENLKKYVSQPMALDIEYSLARAELRKLGVVKIKD
jgi:hypothetical protein